MARYVKDIYIESYRGIKQLNLSGLKDINLITGDNNCGKTSLLEVISTLKNPISSEVWESISRRGNRLSIYNGIKNIFDVNQEEKIVYYTFHYYNNLSFQIEIKAEEEDLALTRNEMESIRNFRLTNYNLFEDDDTICNVKRFNMFLELNKNRLGHLSLYNFERRLNVKNILIESDNYTKINTVYIAPFHHINATLFLSEILDNPELYEKMLSILRKFDDGIISINADRSDDDFSPLPTFKILSRHCNQALPLNVYGDGMKKAILLMSAVIKAKDGILLLDEFETAIHTSIMDDVFNWILNVCMELNIQLFLTSHSAEAIDKILQLSPQLEEKINVITLYKNSDKTVARIIQSEKAIEIRDELGLELRS